MKKDNDDVLAGKIAFTARSSCMPAGVPGFMAYGCTSYKRPSRYGWSIRAMRRCGASALGASEAVMVR
jgi:hypothetical protein